MEIVNVNDVRKLLQNRSKACQEDQNFIRKIQINFEVHFDKINLFLESDISYHRI